MTKKYGARHITIFAVYKKMQFMGNAGRYLEVAFPECSDAQKWINDKCNESSFYKKEDFIVEEMPAIMKAWQP